MNSSISASSLAPVLLVLGAWERISGIDCQVGCPTSNDEGLADQQGLEVGSDLTSSSRQIQAHPSCVFDTFPQAEGPPVFEESGLYNHLPPALPRAQQSSHRCFFGTPSSESASCSASLQILLREHTSTVYISLQTYTLLILWPAPAP